MPDDKVIPVRVALRVRPLITKETSEGCRTCLTFIPGEPQVILGTDKCFTYDYIFNPDAPQEDVYERSVKQLVRSIFKGYNATVLAYGQTGSGKTHTMGGGYGVGFDQEEHLVGVIPRVIKDLFDGMSEFKDYTYDVKVSYLEIYKEDILDLMVPPNQRDKDSVAVREDIHGGIKLTGLREVDVQTPEETLGCLVRGSQGRTTGATAMNTQSSRSHAIFTLHITRTSKNDSQDLCTAKFHLVDLAGSERAKKTGAEGDRFKEGVNINRGLLALGNVISALGSEKIRSHIPYRDSKLTRLLQDSLGGNSHTLMVACVSPADSNMEETLGTLRYADRARKIKNKPIVNRDPQAAEIARLRSLVQELQTQVLQKGITTGGKVRSGGTASANSSLIKFDNSEEVQKVKAKMKDLETENKKLSRELQEALDQCTSMHEKVILSEIAQDNLREQLTRLREKTDQTMSILNVTFNKTPESEGEENSENETQRLSIAPEQLQAMRDIQTSILQLEKDTQTAAFGLDVQTSPDKAASPGGTSDPSMNEAGERAHIMRQAAMNRELKQLTDILTKKQELANQMAGSENRMNDVNIQHEKEIKDLEGNIEKLQQEKDELTDALQQAKAGAASSKVSEQRRKRLQELEAQLSTMRKKVTEQAKVVRLKEQTDKQVTKLNSEIQSMKQARVKIMKQMKEDAETWRKWRQQKDREVMQLKAQDRRRQAEMVKIQSKYQREQNVLKRKAEQAVAVNKRLKDALARQAQVAEERARQQEQHDLSKRGERMKKWLQQEIDVLVSAEEARQTLDVLINDRKALNIRLRKLQDQLEFGPPKKRQLLSNSRTSTPNEEELRKQVHDLDNEIELRNTQIQDIQQKLVDVNQDEKARSRWNSLHSLVEAKSVLRHLLDAAVSAKVAANQRESDLADACGSSDDMQKAVETTEEEMKELKKTHDQELLTLRQEYENKVLYLLGQLNQGLHSSKSSEKPDEVSMELQGRLVFQEKEITRLGEMHEELEKKRLECDALRKELTISKYSGRASLMPEFDAPRDRHFTPVMARKARKRKSFVLGDESDEDDPTMALVQTPLEPKDPDWCQGRTPGYSHYEKRTTRHERTLSLKSNTSLTCSSDVGSTTDSAKPCTCKCNGNCGTRKCPCVKSLQKCSEYCKCSISICKNQQLEEPQSTTDDSLQTVESGNSSQNALNTTFDVAQLNSPSESSQTETDNTVSSTSSSRLTSKLRSNRSTSSSSMRTRKSRETKLETNESFFPLPTTDDSLDESKENSDITSKSGSFFPPPSPNDSATEFAVPKGRPKTKRTLMSRKSKSRTQLGKYPIS